jgi:nitrite reductase/ring-hydroxylating ferredoxin subunit
MGRELVLFRTEGGIACAVDPHCPHLGAHLGEGGTVCGETLRCPFHGFRWDGGGRCVATGYGTRPPPRARLGSWPLREKQGVLLVHHDGRGRAPAWEVPDHDTDGWTPLAHREFVFAGHPQETTENGVDLGHFQPVHGFVAATQKGPLAVDGPRLFVGYRATMRGLRAEFDIAVHGLGYSIVDTRFPALGVRARQLVLATPLDGTKIALRIALRVAPFGGGALPGPARWAIARLVSIVAMEIFAHDVRRDIPIWEHKIHQGRPALARGDGPIGEYRRWCRQFYGAADG